MSDPSLELPEPPAELAELSRQLCTTIVNAIEADGPMPFQRYMAMALYEPGLGYYVNGLHKFGAAGDFVTAPEHGRLFALALARQLDPLGAVLGPDWTMLELGPGSGALARDVLSQLRHPPAKYLLLEPSAPLRDVQRETLSVLPDDLRSRVEWIAAPPLDRFDGAVIANEVVDALPVARFRVGETGIEQARVQVEAGRLAWDYAPAEGRLLRAVENVFSDLPESPGAGYASEICVDLPEWLETVTAALDRGLVLMIDYGYPRGEYYHPDRSDGTLACHYRHRAHFDPFAWPGLTDISAFVDFTALAEAAQACGLEVAGFTNQAGFVLGSGVGDTLDAVPGDCDDDVTIVVTIVVTSVMTIVTGGTTRASVCGFPANSSAWCCPEKWARNSRCWRCSGMPRASWTGRRGHSRSPISWTGCDASIGPELAFGAVCRNDRDNDRLTHHASPRPAALAKMTAGRDSDSGVEPRDPPAGRPDFDQLWKALAPHVRAAVSRHRSRDVALAADDLVQEVRIRVWTVFSGDRNSRLKTSYYYKVVNSAIIDCLRSYRGTLAHSVRTESDGDEREPALIERIGGEEQGPDSAFDEQQRKTRLLEAIRQLPADRRRAVTLFLQGFTVPEIAELMGCDRNRAHNLAYRGVRALKELMGEDK